MHIRPARPGEEAALTELAMRSKAHWGYDDAFMAACRDELTIRPEHLPRIDVADLDGRIVGMVRLEHEAIEDLFVEPDAIGTGVGGELFRHAVRRAATEGMSRLLIDADPNAEGFYAAMGAVKVGESPSGSIAGRVLPQLELAVPAAIEGWVEAEYREWLARLPLSPGMRVLDAGCGNGVPAARLLVELGCEVVGVDLSDTLVQEARDNVPAARFECADLTEWDAEDESFDAIVAFYVRGALDLPIRRWLRPGGSILVVTDDDTVPAGMDLDDWAPAPDGTRLLVLRRP
ncbi:MAG TPA: bifunctional GNAT family N-acetyltransferase/class I SAM-dependent methyltransferase [Acidimicrobiales bacterium]|nr:bifunctional GNAT family N-acetyltransferase/class I SAM-dependent methyltransferase [Acidimicrobiales bacterium]